MRMPALERRWALIRHFRFRSLARRLDVDFVHEANDTPQLKRWARK
jgi:hypothetical protein